MNRDLRYFGFHSSILSLYQIVSPIPEQRSLNCYSNNKPWVFDVNVTIHFFLNSGRSILNDEQILLLLLTKLCWMKKDMIPNFLWETVREECQTYVSQPFYWVFILFLIKIKLATFVDASEMEKKYSWIMKYFRCQISTCHIWVIQY